MKHIKSKQFDEPIELTPLEVKVENGDFEDALKKFRVFFQRERIVGQLKEREAYEKPSAKKRRKKKEAFERKLITEARERMIRSGEWERRQKNKQKKREQKLREKIQKQEKYVDIDNCDG